MPHSEPDRNIAEYKEEWPLKPEIKITSMSVTKSKVSEYVDFKAINVDDLKIETNDIDYLASRMGRVTMAPRRFIAKEANWSRNPSTHRLRCHH